MKHTQPKSAMQQEIADALAEANAPLLAEIVILKQLFAKHVDRDEDRFVTTEQAAKILKLNKATVRRRCRSGEIPFRREGRKMLIDRGDLGTGLTIKI